VNLARFRLQYRVPTERGTQGGYLRARTGVSGSGESAILVGDLGVINREGRAVLSADRQFSRQGGHIELIPQDYLAQLTR
jgi:hypothetical protein